MFPTPFLVPPSVSTYVADRVWLSEFNQSSSSNIAPACNTSPAGSTPSHPCHHYRRNYHQNSRGALYSRLSFRAEKYRVAQVIETICNDTAVQVVWDESSSDGDDDAVPSTVCDDPSMPPPPPPTISLKDTIRFLNRLSGAKGGDLVAVVGAASPASASSSSHASPSTATNTPSMQNDPRLAIGAHNLFADAPFRLWFHDDAVEIADWGEVDEVWDARDQLTTSSTPPNVVDIDRPALISRLKIHIPTYTTASRTATASSTSPTATSTSISTVTTPPITPTEQELEVALRRRAQLVVKHRLLILQVGSNVATYEVSLSRRNATLAKMEAAKNNDEQRMTATGRILLHLARALEDAGYKEGHEKRDSALSFGSSLMSTGAALLEATEASTIHLQNVLDKENQKIENRCAAANVMISRAQAVSSNILSLDVEIERLEAIIADEEKERVAFQNSTLPDVLDEEITKDESACREKLLQCSVTEFHTLQMHHANAFLLHRAHASSLLEHLDRILLHRSSDFVFGVRTSAPMEDDDDDGRVDVIPTEIVSPTEYYLTQDEEATLARIHAHEGFSYAPPSSSSLRFPQRGSGGNGVEVDVNSVEHLQNVYNTALRTSFGRRLCCAVQSSSHARLKKVHEALLVVQTYWKLFRTKRDVKQRLSRETVVVVKSVTSAFETLIENDPCLIVRYCRDTLKLIDEMHRYYYFAEGCPLPGTEGISRLCPPVPPQISENEVDELMTRNLFVMHAAVRWGVSVPFNGRLAMLVCRFDFHGCVVSYRLLGPLPQQPQPLPQQPQPRLLQSRQQQQPPQPRQLQLYRPPQEQPPQPQQQQQQQQQQQLFRRRWPN